MLSDYNEIFIKKIYYLKNKPLNNRRYANETSSHSLYYIIQRMNSSKNNSNLLLRIWIATCVYIITTVISHTIKVICWKHISLLLSHPLINSFFFVNTHTQLTHVVWNNFCLLSIDTIISLFFHFLFDPTKFIHKINTYLLFWAHETLLLNNLNLECYQW